jgi:cytochrome c553
MELSMNSIGVIAARSCRGAALAAALAAVLSGVAMPALADAAAGKAKARACTVCHGALGVSTAPETPHLAGQPERYLGEQLKAYRSGKRQHEVMAVIAKPLSDDDIRDLAEWFASLQVEAREK